MEEITKYRKKSTKKEESEDAQGLFRECQQHLDHLNYKLKGYLKEQRTQQLSCVLPSIDNLNKNIKELKENINYEPTVD